MIEKARWWCKACYVVAIAATAGATFMVLFFVLNGSPVLDYGKDGDVYLAHGSTHATEIRSNDRVDVVFANTTWRRICPTRFAQFVRVGGRRFDIGVHQVSPPGHTGLLPVKSRTVQMPLFGDGIAGDGEFWGEAYSDCWLPVGWWTITTTTPHVPVRVIDQATRAP